MRRTSHDADALRRSAADQDLAFLQHRLAHLLGALDDILGGRIALLSEPARTELECAFAQTRAVGIGFTAEVERLRETVRGERPPRRAEPPSVRDVPHPYFAAAASGPEPTLDPGDVLSLTERAP